MGKDIIISEKQLETLVNGVKKRNIQEHGDEGSYMAKQQLFTIATLAHAMWEKMEQGEPARQFTGWTCWTCARSKTS